MVKTEASIFKTHWNLFTFEKKIMAKFKKVIYALIFSLCFFAFLERAFQCLLRYNAKNTSTNIEFVR